MADLPIDINAIGQMEGYGDALTARYDIELFSEESDEISEAIRTQKQLDRDNAMTELFGYVYYGGAVDLNEAITARVESLALFSEPMNFNSLNTTNDTAAIPLWLVILILSISCAGGFLWAAVSLSGRKRE